MVSEKVLNVSIFSGQSNGQVRKKFIAGPMNTVLAGHVITDMTVMANTECGRACTRNSDCR